LLCLHLVLQVRQVLDHLLRLAVLTEQHLILAGSADLLDLLVNGVNA
jgi:hypothetical protein